MEEAGKLAESTAILLNVSEFQDATVASEALISTMQAFQYTADESGHVVDILNEVGNNYAVSSDGIATALQDSASALMEGGVNLEQAAALVASANRVIQDPSSVGSALRTISLRLRGTSVEILEEMGEETDNVVESTSKLQEKIKALTGVDILTDAGEYKDVYTILREIGEVWQDLEELDKAAALELMAGKNRANTLSAILNNMKDLEGAYNDALQAEGSAIKENEAYLDSIQGRIDLFNNSLQTMWMNFVDTDAVKFIVDLGTAAIKFVDTLGLIPTLLTAFAGFNAIKVGIGLIKTLSESLRGYVAISGLATTSSQAETFAFIKESAAVALADSALVKYAITSGIVTQEQVLNMTTTQLLGTAFLGLAAKIKTATIAFAKFLFTTPLGWITLAIASIPILIGAYDALTTSHEEYVEKLKEETDALKSIQNDLKDVQSELDATKERIDELNAKDSLSFVEEEELNRLKEQTEELKRQEKILQEREARAKEKQAEEALSAAKTDSNFEDQHLYTTPYATVNNVVQSGAHTIGMPYVVGKQAEPENLGNKYEIALKNLKNAQDELEKTNLELESAANLDDDAYSALVKKQADAAEKVSKYNNELDTLFTDWETKYGDVDYFENATTEAQKAWNDFIRQYQDFVDQQRLINGDIGKSEILDRVFGLNGADIAKTFNEKFESEIKAGKDPSKVISDLLSNSNYTSLLNDLETKFGITADVITGYFTQVGENVVLQLEHMDSVKTYSTIVEDVESYNEILSQTREIVSDNTEVTQEYKDALKKLGASEEDINECFDENNKLVVKDSKALNKLVAQLKNNKKATIAAAKAQAQLQYQELTSQMRRSIVATLTQTNAYSVVADAARENVSVMKDQLEALERTIQQYSLLEISLTDAAKAYDEYEKAKERDTQLSYDTSFEEMLKTIDDGILNNETGTEAFEYAVKAIVPEEFWKDIDDVDEKIKSIHDYIDGDPVFSKLFHVDEESGELDINADNVREFVNMGLSEDRGVFVGDDAGSFKLSDQINGIEDVAKAYGVTEAAVLAMFAALEKVDAKWGDILTQVMMTPFDRKVYDATKEIAEANIELAEAQAKLADGSITLEEYNKIAEEYGKKTAEANQNLDTYTKQASDRLLGVGNRDEAIQERDAIKAEATSKGYDGVQTQFGNIDTNDEGRILEWTEKSLEANKAALLSWEQEMNESVDNAWARIQSEYSNSYSTVMGAWDTYDGIDIAFSPLLQTDSGPVLIDSNTLNDYIFALIEKAKSSGKEPTYEVLMELDKEGIEGFEQDGNRIKGVLADVGETAQQTAEIMHFAGATGAIAEADRLIEQATGFIELNKQVAEAQEEVEKSTEDLISAQEAYNQAKADGASEEELQSYQKDVEDATVKVNEHTEAWAELIQKRGEYPSEYEIELVIADIDKEIEEAGNKFDKAIDANFHLDENGRYVINTGVNLEELEKAYPGIIDYIELCNTKTEIQAFADTTSAEEDANQLKKTVDDVIQAIEENLITLDLDEDAVNNIVEQANKILGGIISELGVTISASLPSWLKSVLGWMGFDVSNDNQTPVTQSSPTPSKPKSNANIRQNKMYALGNANATGDVGLKNAEHNAVVGELGPELVCDPIKGIYYTVGDNGTEMVNLPKGAIIYNHKQTEELLKNGHTTRGKYTGGLSFAQGNAHSGEFGIPSHHPNTEDSTSLKNGTGINETWNDALSTLGDAADSLSDAADDISDASDEFRETFDWIEVRLEEINEKLSLKGAQLENAIGSSDQNAIIDDMIALNQKLYDNLIAGANKYYAYSQKLLAKVPEEYRSAAQDGTIAIEDFVGEADEKTLEAIQNYREWVQKGADATQQAEEVITEIRSLAKQQFDNVAQEYDNKISFHDSEIDQLDAHNSLLETDKGFASESIYNAIIGENESKIALLEAQRKDLKAELAGIEVGTQDWYDAVNAIMAVDTEIINLKTDIEDTQDSINELHWEKFELLMTQFEAVANEADNLLDILGTKDAVDELGEWTDEGITSLGLYAQKMEVAEMQAKQYKEEIEYLNTNWKELGYTQEEYVEKLEELKDGQYGAIQSYNDSKEAIVDLNKERIDAIKTIIEDEVSAYEELIEAKKKALDADKD